jgi:aryl-alcohol dehydrogenase
MMGAQICGSSELIVVDKVESRLELARSLGATRTINADEEDALEYAKSIGGVDISFEATGNSGLALIALKALKNHGTCAIVGAYPPGKTVEVDWGDFGDGKTVRHIVEGDADPQTFIPQLVDYFMDGNLPFDRLVKFYEFDQINQAMEDSLNGKVVKPILRIS